MAERKKYMNVKTVKAVHIKKNVVHEQKETVQFK